MIALSRLEKSFGGRTLFADVSLQLNPGSRYGLVGANGAGKSTLMKMVAGDEAASDGEIHIPGGARIGVLRQELSLDDEQIILDLAMQGDRQVWQLLQQREACLREERGEELAELELALRNADGATLEARASAILAGLGIATSQQRQPLGTLSGGFKLRVLLAQVLLSGADILLLDEPTNHLDILSIRWLEQFLANYRGLLLLISHDQRFLDRVVSHVLDVDYGTVTQYTGNYSAFVKAKQEIRERKEAEIARQEAMVAHKRAFVERFGAKASKAKQAQSRLKQIEKIEIETLEQSSRRAPLFRFEQARQSGREVLKAEGLHKSFGEKSVLRGVSLQVSRGEKIAIIGANGLGKSTLLKLLVSALPADQGTVRFGHEVKCGYFAQNHHDLFPNLNQSLLDYIWDEFPSEEISAVRGHLGRLLFSKDEVLKPISALSGGEEARLVFARILLQKPNLLLLDEPTNHLDIEAIDALIEGLKEYPGTLLFVSHDRHFVSEIATRVLEITEAGVRDFPGGYQQYLEQEGEDHLSAEHVVLKAKAEAAQNRTSSAAKVLSWEEEKKRKNRLAALPKKRDKVLAELERAEAQKSAILAQFAEPEFYATASAEQVAQMEAEVAALSPQIDALIAEWEALEQELAEADQASH